MGIEVAKLHPLFAAELNGVDCARPDAALVGLVEDLMREHAVLCIRGQSHIDDEQQLAFARAFGPLELPGHAPHNGGRVAFGLYDVSNLGPDGAIIDPDSPRGRISKGNELFHADSSFNDLPSKWSMLRGVIVTPKAARPRRSTCARCRRAAAGDERPARRARGAAQLLPQPPQGRRRRSTRAATRSRRTCARASGGAPERFGPPALFVGAHTQRIVGMDEAESEALIEELIAFATQPHFVYAHQWRQGDILIWDNRCTLHRGTAYDYRNHKRDMRRATINEAGEDRSAIPAG
jgi:alpha-ketoglutarate-dependent 2,4-dichlorophenoxyacetate dioxygenase